MVDVSKLKMDKIEHPATFYETPDDIVKDNDLSTEEKKKALNSWEQDARQQLTASSEGMAGSNEGVDPSDHPRLGEIQRAKDKIGEKPKQPIGRYKSVWSLSALPPKQTLTPREAVSALCQ